MVVRFAYLSHEIAVRVKTEADIDRMAMKFEILQYIKPKGQLLVTNDGMDIMD